MNENYIIKKEELFENYYFKLNELIIQKKQSVIKNINYEMVELYYEIGRTINELIEKYNLQASQNEIIKSFSIKLTSEFGQGFSVPNLKKMKKFYLTYKSGSTLWNQLKLQIIKKELIIVVSKDVLILSKIVL